MKNLIRFLQPALILSIFLSCAENKNQDRFKSDLQALDLNRGDIALCGSEKGQFGTVAFGLACSEKVRTNFNLATALLHSFEYSEAEKVFAKVIDEDPECVMAYWGVAMSNFHPLWAQPSDAELQKGEKVIALGRSMIEDTSTRESDYLEAIAAIYDDWENQDHKTRILKFEKASEEVYKKYTDDNEAAIFYALALRASADPTDKTFVNQKKAGEILESILAREPNHPGVTHYIIHNYDYPELAELALPAARKYASIAAASAHAQHMPSHIFIRLGLWDESIQSNKNSISAAQCYAQNMNIKGHWDEELHGLDYLIYAYLQKADDENASEQVKYFNTIHEVFPKNFKDAYSFASIPTRYALERKNWKEAAQLKLGPEDFPWDKFLWEKANVNFGKALGAVHINKLDDARHELKELKSIHTQLIESKELRKANFVLIQIKASEGWIKFAEGKLEEAITLMRNAADMEDATEKDPVTPGEVIPARELLGDLYFELEQYANALAAYEADLKRHSNRFNGLYGAGRSAEKLKDAKKATEYYSQLMAICNSASNIRAELASAKSYLKKNS